MEPVETGWKRIDNWSKTGFSLLGAFPHTNIFSLIKNIQKIQGGRVKMFFLVKIFWEVASTKGRAKWLQIYGLVLLEEDLSMTISINFLCIRNLWFVYYLLVTAADFYYSLHVKEKNYCCKLPPLILCSVLIIYYTSDSHKPFYILCFTLWNKGRLCHIILWTHGVICL